MEKKNDADDLLTLDDDARDRRDTIVMSMGGWGGNRKKGAHSTGLSVGTPTTCNGAFQNAIICFSL